MSDPQSHRKRDLAMGGGGGAGLAALGIAALQYIQGEEERADAKEVRCAEECLELMAKVQTQLDTCAATVSTAADHAAATASAQFAGFQAALIELAKLCQ